MNNGYESNYYKQMTQYEMSAIEIGKLLQGLPQEKKAMLSGNKPVVVCGGEVKEAKDLDEAQGIAESVAHSKSADAYVLKPVRKVSPKRDVVTTELS